MNIEYNDLLNMAKKAKARAYSPYSTFSVGAALLCADGKVYTGCNVENAAFGPTCCAERVAVFSAIADGCRDFVSIAIVGDRSSCMPCGVCRQVISEFCDGDFKIITEDENGKAVLFTLDELLPNRFNL